MRVREAELKDLPKIVEFTATEAIEAEGLIKIPATLEKGIKTALQDSSISKYWVLVDDEDHPLGCVSVIKEWSNWNAGFYWWVQSMFIIPEHRGKDYMSLLLNKVKEQMIVENGLELRLYVHGGNKSAIKAYEKSGFQHSKYKVMTYKR